VPIGVCFVAGTLVLTPSGALPIESLDIGQRVLTTDSGTESRDGPPPFGGVDWFAPFGEYDESTAVNPATWRLVELSMPNPGCPNDTIAIRSLRPQSWVEKQGYLSGRTVWFELPEMGLAGSARVLAVGPCPQIEAGPGRIVLSTVTHLNGHVMQIWLEGLINPLELTLRHRLFSEERSEWTAAGELRVGDEVRTIGGGRAAITRINRKPGVHRVYNIEVETEHSYYVSATGVLSHNANPCGLGGRYAHLDATDEFASKRGPGKEFSDSQRRRILEENRRLNGGAMKCDDTSVELRPEAGYDNSAEIHHVVPKSRGGTNHYNNASVLSRKANRARGNRQ
jgi:hypothetical protein